MMKKRLTIFLLILGLLMPIAVMAQNAGGERPDGDASKREQWFKEMRTKKHEFLIRELELTSEQQEPFFAIYDKMDDELKAINDQTRALERRVSKKADATDAEYDAAIEAVYSQRYREWMVESQAKEQLSKILNKRQMLKLKRAEFKFTRALMKQHRQARDKSRSDNK